MPRKWSTGALVAMGLGAWFIGLGMGGRIMAQYCVNKYGPLEAGRNQRRRRRALRGGFRP